MPEVTVLPATPADAPAIMDLIRELADYEKMPEGVKIDESQLARDLEREALLGLILREDGVPAGMVLYYYAYSTWEGQFVHMEDLYVQPQHRRKGYGRKLWAELGKMPSCNLTESEGWLAYRLSADGIAHLASHV